MNYNNTAIVITDGQSNVNHSGTIPEAMILQQVAEVYVVGVTDEIDFAELVVRYPNFLWWAVVSVEIY